MLRRWPGQVLVAALVLVCPFVRAHGEGPGRANASEQRQLDDAVQALLKAHGHGVTATIWVGGASGPAAYAHEPATIMPTASAVKTFYLLEFFAAHHDALDKPLDGAGAILNDDSHPAISHFSPAIRKEIRRDLGTATVRRIGQAMMGQTDVSNAVYNAAANLVTADLGGPEKLTGLIHARDPRFQTVMVRRYMLRDRTQPGDNEAPSEAFAALYQSLASRKLTGVDAIVMKTVHECLLRSKDAQPGPLYEKDGGLSTDPLTAVKAGWYQAASGPVVFVVMCRQPTVESSKRTAVYEQLQALSVGLRNDVVKATAWP